MTPIKGPARRVRKIPPIQSLDDLQPDPLNANRGTDRGREALRRSLHTYGAGRSIVIDKRGRILGGHKTVEQAKHLGLPITVVPTTGQELVVVRCRNSADDNPPVVSMVRLMPGGGRVDQGRC